MRSRRKISIGTAGKREGRAGSLQKHPFSPARTKWRIHYSPYQIAHATRIRALSPEISTGREKFYKIFAFRPRTPRLSAPFGLHQRAIGSHSQVPKPPAASPRRRVNMGRFQDVFDPPGLHYCRTIPALRGNYSIADHPRSIAFPRLWLKRGLRFAPNRPNSRRFCDVWCRQPLGGASSDFASFYAADALFAAARWHRLEGD